MNSKEMWKASLELSDKNFKLYVIIEKMADNDLGYCFAGDEVLGKKIGKHRTNVNSGVQDLIRLGYLNILKLEKGASVVERRLYPTSSFKQYLLDIQKKISKTYYETFTDEDGAECIRIYNNDTISLTSSEITTPKITSSKTATGTSSNITTGTSSEIATVIYSNNTITNINNQNNQNQIKDLNNKDLNFDLIKKFLEKLSEGTLVFNSTIQNAISERSKTMIGKELRKYLTELYQELKTNPEVRNVNAVFVKHIVAGTRQTAIAEPVKKLETVNAEVLETLGLVESQPQVEPTVENPKKVTIEEYKTIFQGWLDKTRKESKTKLEDQPTDEFMLKHFKKTVGKKYKCIGA